MPILEDNLVSDTNYRFKHEAHYNKLESWKHQSDQIKQKLRIFKKAEYSVECQ